LLPVAAGILRGGRLRLPTLDTLFLAAPISCKGAWSSTPGGSCAPTLAKPPPKIGDYLNRPEVPGARIHRGDSNHDSTTGVLAASLAKRAAGYTSPRIP
jgi:hypothetical protein